MDLRTQPANGGLDRNQVFARLAAVTEIGHEGLEKLRSSRVAIAGVGGVGSAAAEYLARSGIGFLRLVDQDIIEQSNLSRLHEADLHDLHFPKAEVLANKISERYPWTKTSPIVETLREDNVVELLEGMDIILDGLDNFRTRYVVNRFSVRRHTPYLFASAVGNQGHIAHFMPPETPCLECTFHETVDGPEDSCEVLGVTPTAVGVIGSLAANEAVKFLACNNPGFKGKLLTLDLDGPELLVTNLTKRAECPTCSGTVKTKSSVESSWLLCGEKSANLLPRVQVSLNLSSIAKNISQVHQVRVSDSVLVFRRGSLVVSLFRNGRLIIRGIDDGNQARAVAEDIWNQIAAFPEV